MMDDVIVNRQTVLEIVLDGLHIPREVYELRYCLFLRAANKYFYHAGSRELLEPFPTCFYDFATKTRLYEALEASVAKIPKLKDINNRTSLPEPIWALLSWIFTNPLKIEAVKQSEISEYLSDVLREETKLSNIPNPSHSCYRFDITHEEAVQKKAFLAHKAEYGSFFAYHGSPGHNFHSIIHRGLRCSLNVRQFYGPGSYLTSYLETATSYAARYWGYSGDVSIKYCVAIVEVIKHPSVKVVNHNSTGPAETLEVNKFADTSSNNHRYYVVNSDELMRLRHLLVYYN
ncbi:protein mono-ADP-ribosyltransferase PARP16-like isoform X2 [Bradysia coprophila]|uniref:protein mono-ADP-ribosyltransferase PARP16-like isoform X2 n=1 Tax=Bradysia coprophila TaxID=38358 RepID=UPI00187D9DE1|nr:protein mono-ADP-ribosyltransferase PARP16-like isoform X2 [Bradysia coprophila]